MKFKKPLTIEKQIAHLKRQKEIVFTNIDEMSAADILTREKYINVVTTKRYE